jgi:hypothetical protein
VDQFVVIRTPRLGIEHTSMMPHGQDRHSDRSHAWHRTDQISNDCEKLRLSSPWQPTALMSSIEVLRLFRAVVAR